MGRMAINYSWSDMLYPDNPKLREEVEKLKHSILMSVILIYNYFRTVSKCLNQVSDKFNILPEFNWDLTFQQSFDLIKDAMTQVTRPS